MDRLHPSAFLKEVKEILQSIGCDKDGDFFDMFDLFDIIDRDDKEPPLSLITMMLQFSHEKDFLRK